MRQPATVLLLATTLILSALPVRAYTLQFTDAPNSVQVKWPTRNIRVALSSSLSAPQSNIKPGSDVVGAARRALAHWAEAANIRFITVTANAQSISASGTRGDGLSLITVAHTAENTEAFAGEGSDMPGRTRVFSTIAGSITEADIALNPSQPFSTDGTPGTYDLEATFTHEIGHLLGLEHSAVLGATMQPRAARNGIYNLPALSPRTLSEDDRAGARALYGARLGSGSRGSIQGTIDFVSGATVFGANVWAEEAATGRVVASSITLSNGAYRMEGLLPGEYRVFAAPLGGPVAASEIASQRGAYASLALNQQFPFRAEEIGRVTVEQHSTTILNAQLSGLPSLINPSFIGINRELSTVAVPLVPGQAYRVFLSGEGLKASQFYNSGITTTSPFIIVDSSSVKDEDFGEGISVISFDLMLAGDIQAGEYSLRLQTVSGDVAYVVGGLTIDGPESAALVKQDDTTDDELGIIADESIATDYK
ncbi:MAG TPA: matrixin family metalloprotease [Pyrinomonadaceae bacterium]|nr:matrixin family metalloprotease [Pyrinomonadaceae bacterium]